jgi:DNA-binding MarR family transcriptional regulator
MEKELEKRNITGIAPSCGDILFALDRQNCRTVQDVARATNKDKSTISSVINRLVANGYIRKDRDEEDARVTRLTLTPKAVKLRPGLYEISDAMNRRIFQGLTAEEKDTLFGLMEKIHNTL